MALNPFSIVPVFHFRRDRREIQSEFANALPLQDAVNKLLADMMVAAEYGAFRQRYIISQGDPGVMKNSPNEIWMLQSGDGAGQGTQVGEFSATDLSNYLAAMDKLASSIATITRTPKHYFLATGGDPSGEALMTMESPLVKKATRYIARFTPTWKALASFLLALDGSAIPPASITPIYDAPETIQPKTAADIRKVNVESGIPIVTILRNEGWTQEQLDVLAEDKQAEQSAGTAGLAQALLAKQRSFDQGEDVSLIEETATEPARQYTGVQITSAMEIVQNVSSGAMGFDNGMAMMQTMLGFDEQQARAMLQGGTIPSAMGA
jgi:hypothetical protein